MPQISVVVPVYSVEKYLDECVRSVTNQTYRNIEIILVDDGSPDGCSAICDRYCMEDSRIVTVHKANGGLGNARNIGVDVATGKYVEFLDSDDWLLPETVDICVNEAETNHLDILLFSARSFVEEGNIVDKKIINSYTRTACCNEVLEGASCFSAIQGRGEYISQICMRFYRKDYWNHYRFLEGIIHEDEDVGFLSMINAKRVEILGDRFYQRRYHSGSIMTSKSNIRSAEGYAAAFGSLAEHYCDSETELHELYEKQMSCYLYNVLKMYRGEEKKGAFKKKVQPYLRKGLETGIHFSKENQLALKSLGVWQYWCAIRRTKNKMRSKLSAVYHRVKKH